jgi:uncharacterized repeat protein (TIGR01451 family)
MPRLPLPIVVLFLPIFAAAHPVVDLSIAIEAPPFAARSGAITYLVHVTDLAYDPATGIVVTDTLPPGAKFTTASGSGWTCSESKGTITCSAEILYPGVSTISIAASAPPQTGTAANKASLISLGTFDFNQRNDTASIDTLIYDTGACKASAPIITGTQWTASGGATKYLVQTAVEGARPYVLEETAGTQLDATFEPGRNEWWVDAVFTGCPPLSSAHVETVSNAPPRRAYIDTLAVCDRPVSIGVDVYGEILIADEGDSSIRFIDPKGNVFLIAGTPGHTGSNDGDGQSAQFNHPHAIAVAAGGYAFIADTGNGSVRMLYPSGNGAAAAILGTLTDGLSAPAGVAVTPAYTVYVSDTGNHQVKVLTVGGGVLGTAGPYDAPTALAVDDHDVLYVVDGDSIKRGTTTFAAGFDHPTAIAFDSLGNLYVAETGGKLIRRIAPSGTVTTVIDHGLVEPTGLAFDAAGRLLIADRGDHEVKVVTTTAPPDRRRATRH